MNTHMLHAPCLPKPQHLPKSYYEEAGIVLYHADCREILPLLEPVDLVLTDPPYGVGYDTWDDSCPYDLLPLFLSKCVGTVIWFGAAPQVIWVDKFYPRPARILIWAPRFTLSHAQQDGISFRWHPIYCWNIPRRHDGPVWDILSDSTETGNWWKHTCTKPLSLIKRFAAFSPEGGQILDPFCGSGTTLVAAKQLGRRAIGIEREERYCAIAVERLRQSVLPFPSTPAPGAQQTPLFQEKL